MEVFNPESFQSAARISLTAFERRVLLEKVPSLPADIAAIVRNAPPRKPIEFMVSQLDELADLVANEADATLDGKVEDTLVDILHKIDDELGTEEPDGGILETLLQTGVPLSDAIVAAEAVLQMWLRKVHEDFKGTRMKSMEVANYEPQPFDRVLMIEGLKTPDKLRKKLQDETSTLTANEICQLVQAIAKVCMVDPIAFMHLLPTAESMMVALDEWRYAGLVAHVEEPSSDKIATNLAYQFKIILKYTTPPIWRRIIVPDGTLDQLHEWIQTAMGWTNSHLHQFTIKGVIHGDPQLLQEGLGDLRMVDSRHERLSEIFSRDSKKLRFLYEYDFGDGWEHDIMLEKVLSPEEQDQKVKLPVCVGGKFACPPEDCGGTGGYDDLLCALANPKHPDSRERLEWFGGKFDPEKFDAKKATKSMRQGLPDWRTH